MLLEQTCCFLLLTFPAQYVHFTRLTRSITAIEQRVLQESPTAPLFLVDYSPQFLRGKRHFDICHAKRISNRVCNRGRGTDGTGLTDTFHTQRIDWSRGDSGIGLEAGKLCGKRHGIVSQRCGQKLTILTVNDSLIHCLANALRKTTVNLAFDKHGVELASTVINRYITRNLHLASILVYLDHAYMCAEGEGIRCWFPEGSGLQTGFNIWRQGIGEVSRHGYLAKGNSFLWGAGHKEITILQRHIRSAGLQHMGSNKLHLFLQPLDGVKESSTTYRRGATH